MEKLSGNIIKCRECGQEVDGNEYHTYESCLLHKLNECRIYLGKPPISIDIKGENRKTIND